MPDDPVLVRYHVHIRDAGHHGHVVEAVSFEAAAVAFAEVGTHDAADDQLALIVCEIETGHERCFRVDLATGDAGPCAA